MKSKNTILFEDCIGEHLYNFGVGKDFLNKTQKMGMASMLYTLECGCQMLSSAPSPRKERGHVGVFSDL